MDLDPEILAQLVAVFRVELDEQLQIITDGLLALERPGTEPAPQLDQMFRAAHNIKGAARGVGVTDLATLAHALESLFSRFKRAGTAPPAELVDLCFGSLDRMRELMAAFSDQGSAGFDLDQLVLRLEQAAESAEAAPTAPPPAPAPAVVAAPAAVPVAAAAAPVVPTAPVAAAPRNEPADAAAGAPELVRIGVDKLERLGARADAFQLSRIQLEEQFAEVGRLDALVQEFARLWTGGARACRTLDVTAVPPDLYRLFHAGADLVAEIGAMSERLHRQMRRAAAQQTLLSNGFQDEVRMLRLVPCASALRPLARAARDVARELGKRVDLTVEGEQIELDRQVLDALRDPLNHLLRNAIDHGIEPPEVRRARGKAETGLVAISVSAMGGEIALAIEDDGGGVDVERVARVAVRRGVVSEDELVEMDEAEVRDLIFRPGFSTRDEVTAISGRGVGLDVVHANLQAIKGSVRVESAAGGGSRFLLTVPLTLASDRGLLVRAGGAAYAIPVHAVERVLEVARTDVMTVEATQAVAVEGRPVALRELAAVLGGPAEQPAIDGVLPLVVLAHGWHRVALRVDELLGEREIVVKPLMPPLYSVRHVSGATLTGSGEVMMVLNPAQVVESALQLESPAPAALELPQRPPRVLVVDDSITTRTLERTILENKGFDVTTAVNGKEAWELLQGQSFDLVISDVEMPVMTGLELTALVKQSPTLRQTPVIIVSSLGKEEHRRAGMEVGADAYIVKSDFETRALLEVVRQLI